MIVIQGGELGPSQIQTISEWFPDYQVSDCNTGPRARTQPDTNYIRMVPGVSGE